jgi:hypothetical protein
VKKPVARNIRICSLRWIDRQGGRAEELTKEECHIIKLE